MGGIRVIQLADGEELVSSERVETVHVSLVDDPRDGALERRDLAALERMMPRLAEHDE